MGRLIYSIHHLPDLTLIKYQSLSDGGLDGVLKRNESFLRQWQKISANYKVDLCYLVEYNPDFNAGERLRFFLIIESEFDFLDSYFDSIMMSSSLAEIYELQQVNSCPVDDLLFSAKGVVKKCERKRNCIINDAKENVPLFFVENWKGNDESRLYELYNSMAALNKHIVYRVLLKGTDDYNEVYESLDKPISFLRKRTINRSSEQIKLIQNDLNRTSRDVVAEDTLKTYEEFLKKISGTPCYRANIELYAENEVLANILLNTACGESIEEGNWEIFTSIEGNYSSKNIFEAYNKIMPPSLSYWPTYFALDEIVPFFRLPILYEGENIEIKKETVPSRMQGDFFLGVDLNLREVYLPSKMFNKHVFICGVPGAGKTNTMLHLCHTLWKVCQIPFLVLEPAKKEYRALAQTDINELVLFSPSSGSRFPLAINPFEFALGLSLSEHIQNLMDVFEGAFPLSPPLPALLDRAIENVYKDYGWDTDDVNDGTRNYPRMSELYQRLKIELEHTDYDGEVRGNMKSALEMRIGSLLRRDLGNVFDVPMSSFSPEDILKYPVIIEMESLGTGPSNFLTLMLCTLIREVLKVNPQNAEGKDVRHVLFIEEAHNLIAADIRQPSDTADPKIAATNFIIKMLAEVRALGEGIVIADQLPTAMAPEVLKNTSVKIVHRLTSQDDRALVGSTMSASGMQMEELGSFLPGSCLISYEGLLKPFQMRMTSFHFKDVPSTERLFELMGKRKLQRNISKITFSIQLSKHKKRWIHEWDIMLVVYDKFIMDCDAYKACHREDEIESLLENIVKDQMGLDKCVKELRRIKKKYDFLLALAMEADEHDVKYSLDMENSIKKIINNVKILLAQVKGR